MPGNDVEIYCYKGHWRVHVFETSELNFSRFMVSADSCEIFEPAPYTLEKK
jgi:hypothetical protein